MEQEVAAGGPFAKLVKETTPDVAAIFTGHTHKEYAWDAPPVLDANGQPTGKTRPIVQTGNYGENVGSVTLTVDTASKSVTAYKAAIVDRTTDTAESLVSAYPRVATVKTVVDKALAEAAVIGNQPVGAVTADITTAFTPGSCRRRPQAGRSRERIHARQPGGGLPRGYAQGARTGFRGDRRREPPRRAAQRAVLRAGRHHHLRRGQRGPAFREQPLDHVPDWCAVQDTPGTAVADKC